MNEVDDIIGYLTDAYNYLARISRIQGSDEWREYDRRWIDLIESREERTIEETFILGEKTYQLGRFDESERFLREAAASGVLSNERSAKAFFSLGDIALRRSDEKWRNYFCKGIEALAGKDDKTFLDCYQLGEKSCQVGDAQGARTWFEKALEHPVSFPRLQSTACFMLGDLHLQAGNNEECRRYFGRGVEYLEKKPDKNREDIYRLGEKSFQSGNDVKGRQYFEQYVENGEGPPDLLAHARKVLHDLRSKHAEQGDDEPTGNSDSCSGRGMSLEAEAARRTQSRKAER